jgi:hypothetical protein
LLYVEAHFKLCCRKQQLDLIIPPENVDHNPGDHHIEDLLAETNKQNDQNYQYQPRQLPHHQQQTFFSYPTDNRHPAVFPLVGNSTVMPTSTAHFYSYHPTSYSNPPMPYQESSHAGPIAVSYCLPSNANPTGYYNYYNYQYNAYNNNKTLPIAPHPHFFQQHNSSHYVDYTNGGWIPYINPTEASPNPNIMYCDPTNNLMVPTMLPSTVISADSCAVISVLDATASSDPHYNDETTSSEHGYSYFSGMNSFYPSTPFLDCDYHCNHFDSDDDEYNSTPCA